MKVALGIPHWGTDPHRRKNYEHVLMELNSYYGWSDLLLLKTAEQPGGKRLWNRGAARNWLVLEALERDCDVIVLCDSDIIPEVGALHQAIQGAYSYGGLHFPFDKYQYLNEQATDAYLDRKDPLAYGGIQMEGPGSLGGIMAIRPHDWLDAGGSPELEGWGFEDVIFAVCARTLLRPNTWYPGRILHLWHPSDCKVGSPDYERNIAVCKAYEAADGNHEEIWRLIHARG